MADKRLTLFELHIAGDVQIGPTRLPGDTADDPEESPPPDPPTRRSHVGKLVVGIVVLGLLAGVIWRVLTGNERHTAPIDSE